jgi:hypothetical protein
MEGGAVNAPSGKLRISGNPGIIMKSMTQQEDGFMNVDCYLSHGCGSEAALKENITRALAMENVEADIHCYRIDDEKAIALGLSGSPSVFVDGKEIQPQGVVGFS